MGMALCWTFFFTVTPGLWALYKSGVSPKEYTKEQEFTVTLGKTVYYWTLVMGQIGAAICTTTKLQSIVGLCDTPYGLPNCVLNIMFLFEIVLGLVAIYLPFMQGAFNTGPLPMEAVLWPVLAVFVILTIEEIRKLIGRAMDTTPEDDESGSSWEGSEEDESGSGTYGSYSKEGSSSEEDGSAKPLLC